MSYGNDSSDMYRQAGSEGEAECTARGRSKNMETPNQTSGIHTRKTTKFLDGRFLRLRIAAKS
jgi:hypothetical protein